MASFNKVILLGNLTRDPEVRYTPKGSAVCDLGIAVNRVYTTEGGERREEVTFVDVVLWARLAEIAGEYLRKGRPIFIEGRLQMDSWDDKQTGQKRTKLRVVGESMQLLGGRPGGAAGETTKKIETLAAKRLRRRSPLNRPSQTTTKFPSKNSASSLRLTNERDGSMYRAQYAADSRASAAAKTAGGIQAAARNSRS
jgi:single stranded DNA-binding protein (ssb)